jgi:hypothetical protein
MRGAQELHKARPQFCASQQGRIDGLWGFVQKQRVLRKQVLPCSILAAPACIMHTCLQSSNGQIIRYQAVIFQGPSAKEARRDTTTFEAARAEWSKATLSAKGSVGGTGDHRSEVWLG